MKFRKILSSVVAMAITGTLFVGSAINASAVSFDHAKELYITEYTWEISNSDKAVDFETTYLVGVLSKTGSLYTYDGEMNKTLVSKDVEWASGRYYLKKGVLYNISTKKSVLKNISAVYGHVAKTTSGDYYFIEADKPVKLGGITKKVYGMSFNGDGNFFLFTSNNSWDGGRYMIDKYGNCKHYE